MRIQQLDSTKLGASQSLRKPRDGSLGCLARVSDLILIRLSLSSSGAGHRQLSGWVDVS